MRTSKGDFVKFRKCFGKWQEKLGMQNYEILFEHVALEGNDAELEYFGPPCAAVVRLNKETGTMPRTMDDLPKHEAIELLLAPLGRMARKRDFQEDVMEMASHSIVQSLMRVIS